MQNCRHFTFRLFERAAKIGTGAGSPAQVSVKPVDFLNSWGEDQKPEQKWCIFYFVFTRNEQNSGLSFAGFLWKLEAPSSTLPNFWSDQQVPDFLHKSFFFKLPFKLPNHKVMQQHLSSLSPFMQLRYHKKKSTEELQCSASVLGTSTSPGHASLYWMLTTNG